jgi:hypothetical protein
MLMFWIPGFLQPYCHSLHLAGLKRCENQNCITCFGNIYCVFISVLFNFYQAEMLYLKIQAFWDVMLCHLVNSSCHF